MSFMILQNEKLKKLNMNLFQRECKFNAVKLFENKGEQF